MTRKLFSILVFMLSTSVAHATDDNEFSHGRHFEETTGEALYTHICQGCHMPDAKGAQGAGKYPALAGNIRLVSAAYMINIISNGQGGMPPFRSYLSDEQIAEVVNYTRTHFGNEFAGAVKADDVKPFTHR